MDSIYDYQKFAVLYVDDEEMSLKYFTRAFQNHFHIYTATNVTDGLRLFDEHKDEIAVVISDQRMPGEKGVRLLELVRESRPRTIRILTTAYSDISAAIEAVNSGAIYKYITKPWDIPQLEMSIKRGLEFFLLQRERDQLLREKLSTIHNLMITDRVISLGLVAAGLGRHMRNSLAAVQRFIDLAPAKLAEENIDIERLQNPNFWKDFYQQVLAQMQRVTALLGELVVAPEKPNYPFNDSVTIGTVLDGAIDKLKSSFQAKQIALASKIPADLPPLLVEQAKFQRLFELLLRSESEQLPSGSRVDIQASQLANGDEPQVQIEISDNGPGLPEQTLRSLFDPFFLHDGSTYEFGVNLMAAYFIVYHHGGAISARTRPTGGTQFTLTFPIQPRSVSPLDNEQAFLAKVVMNDALWEKLLQND